MPGRHSSKAKYTHHRLKESKEFEENTLKTVPVSHSTYEGKLKKVKGAKAIVGRLKPEARKKKGKRGKPLKSGTQSILVPKKTKTGKGHGKRR